LVDADSYCLADSMKKTIVAYKKAAAPSVTLDLSTIGTEKGYSVNWYSPSVGGALIPAQPIVKGGASWTLAPPSNPTADWALLVQCATNCE
jgi:Putative collagen-binding domain of a collagenase